MRRSLTACSTMFQQRLKISASKQGHQREKYNHNTCSGMDKYKCVELILTFTLLMPGNVKLAKRVVIQDRPHCNMHLYNMHHQISLKCSFWVKKKKQTVLDSILHLPNGGTSCSFSCHSLKTQSLQQMNWRNWNLMGNEHTLIILLFHFWCFLFPPAVFTVGEAESLSWVSRECLLS